MQGIKRGIMEMAHAIIVAKTDIDEQAARMATAMYTSALRLLHPPIPSLPVPVLPISSRVGSGVAEVVAWLDGVFADDVHQQLIDQRRRQRRAWFDAILQQEIVRRLMQHPDVTYRLGMLHDEVDNGTRVPTVAVYQFLAHVTLSFQEFT